MKTLSSIAEVRAARRALVGTVGLVPTMGSLHEGHLSLVRQARAANDHVFVSIFVNPTQFGPNEDFTAYPRDIDRDLELLELRASTTSSCPPSRRCTGRALRRSWMWGLSLSDWKARSRPGHFRGVATVVLKLLNIVQPTRAYFGSKDAQQLVVIRTPGARPRRPVEIVAVPNGARAGRPGDEQPQRLPQRRPSARPRSCLHEALELAREMWTRGVRDAGAFRSRMRELIESEELARIDYVSHRQPGDAGGARPHPGRCARLDGCAHRQDAADRQRNVRVGMSAVPSLSQTHPPAKMPSINIEST